MIVIYLTAQDTLDYHLLSDFFLTFRQFMSSAMLLELLIGRLAWALNVQSLNLQNETGRSVSVRTFVMLRHWILNFFPDDFVPSYSLRVSFSIYINALFSWNLAQQNPAFMHILNQLKKCWLRSCSLYWTMDEPNTTSLQPGGALGANFIDSQPSTRRTTLLSMYQAPIKPILSISEFTNEPEAQDNLLSMMGSLIKGGISLSTDVEVCIFPPTPVKTTKSQKAPILSVSNRTWSRDFWQNKNRVVSKFISKIINVSDRKALPSKAFQSSEHGKVRIDILSARVIEELDSILKLRDMMPVEVSTANSNDFDFTQEQPELVQDSPRSRISFIDTLDMRSKIQQHNRPEVENVNNWNWDSDSDDLSAVIPPECTSSTQSFGSSDSQSTDYSPAYNPPDTPTRTSMVSGFSSTVVKYHRSRLEQPSMFVVKQQQRERKQSPSDVENPVAKALSEFEGTYPAYIYTQAQTEANVAETSIAAAPTKKMSPASSLFSIHAPVLLQSKHDSQLYSEAFETPTRRSKKMDMNKRQQGRPVSGDNDTEIRATRSRLDLLSVASSVQHGNHTPFILNFSSEALVAQLTLIERDALAEVDWKELIDQRWKQNVPSVHSWLGFLAETKTTTALGGSGGGVEVVVTRFNLTVNWIKSEILLTRSLADRVQTVTRFIHVAAHARRLQNYSTMMQIVLALSSGAIKCLKRTWANISTVDVDTLDRLEKIVMPFRNFQRLRAELNSLDTDVGCIPFLGVYLSDLTYNAERPAFVKAEPKDGSSKLLVNFDRFRTSAAVVKSLMQCIDWSRNYQIKPDHDLLAKCLYIQALSEDEMKSCYQYLDE